MARQRSEREMLRVGLVSLMTLALALTVAFNIRNLPGVRGTTYHARFTDASGLVSGDRVEVAGIHVGQVDSIRIDGDHVDVEFDVDGVKLGSRTSASIEVLDLLGQKFLNLEPSGSTELAKGATIPATRTTAGYDLVGTLDELTRTTGEINTGQLATAFNTLSSTLDQATPEIRRSFTGMARLSQTIASNDQDLSTLLKHANHVVTLLNQRKGDLIGLMREGNLIFQELISRRQAIHELLTEATTLSHQLSGLATDNKKQIGPALRQLHQALTFLNARKKELSATIKNYGPYVTILENIVGDGPWFDAYVPNLVGIGDGEFQVGHRPGLN